MKLDQITSDLCSLSRAEVTLVVGQTQDVDLAAQHRLVLADFLARTGFGWAQITLIMAHVRPLLHRFSGLFETALNSGADRLPSAFLAVSENRFAVLYIVGDGISLVENTTGVLDLETGETTQRPATPPGWTLTCSISCIFLKALARLDYPTKAEDFAAGRIALGYSS